MAITNKTRGAWRNKPVDERREMARFLLASIEEDTLPKENPAQHPIEVMETILGHPIPEGKSREASNARMIIAIYLLEQGFTLSKIGEFLGRDHSTIIHYRSVWYEMQTYPKMYASEISMFHLFRAMV